MYNRDERLLGAVARSAYESLLEIMDADSGIPRSDAHAQLLEADFADGDAGYQYFTKPVS